MAGRVFAAGDTHIGHKNATEFRGFKSQSDHDLTVMNSCLEPLGKRDVLVLLGDIFFTSAGHFDAILIAAVLKKWPRWNPEDNLPFTLKIVLGNHDRIPRLAESRFIGLSQIMMHTTYMVDGEKYLLTHFPVNTCEVSETGRYSMNIHGHLHTNKVDDYKSEKYTNLSWEINRTSIRIK